MLDLRLVFDPAIDLLKQFLNLSFSFYGITIKVEDVFIFMLLTIGVLAVFKIFKHS